MSLASLAADAREAGSLERVYPRIYKSYLKEARRESFRKGPFGFLFLTVLSYSFRVLSYLLPLVPATLAFFLEPGGLQRTFGWAYLGCLALLQTGSFLARRIASLSEFEALRMPSRGGVLVARWVRSFPHFAWRGLAWSLFAFAKVSRFADPWTAGTWALLVAIGLVPLANGLAQGLDRLQSEEATSIRSAFLSRILSSRGLLGLLWATIIPLFILPISLVEPAFVSSVWLCGPLALCIVVFLSYSFLRSQLDAVTRCEIPTGPWYAERKRATPSQKEEDQPGNLSPGTFLSLARPGRGLWRAELECFQDEISKLTSWRRISGPEDFARRISGVLRLVFNALFLMRGPILGAAAVLEVGEPHFALPLAAASGFLASKFLGSWVGALGGESSVRLYLLGVDFRDQVIQELKAMLIFAVLPTLGASLLAAVLAGFELSHLAMVLFIAAVFLLRVGWEGLLGFSETTAAGGCLRVFLAGAVVAFLIVGKVSFTAETILLIAAISGAIGALGLFNRLRRLREEDLRTAVRRDPE